MVGDDKVEVSIGSGKIAIAGGNVGKISGTIVDLLSPFSEGLGWIGDALRIYREKSISKMLSKAQDIASKRDEVIHQVNPKNLVSIIEGASLENEDEDIIEIWARLLLSGGSEFDAELSVITEILRRIGGDEINILANLVNHPEDIYFPDLTDTHNKEKIKDLLEGALILDDADGIALKMKEILESADLENGKILYVGDQGPDHKFTYFGDTYSTKTKSVNVLHAERLIDIKNLKVDSKSTSLSVIYCEAMPMAISMVRRCYPNRGHVEK
jgi:hypothetical protein